MKEVKIESKLTVYENLTELPDFAKKLMEKAVEIRLTAYAPYSNFSVGAAILMANGEIITGSNQENASYPSGLCAERSALFYAGSKYPNMTIDAIAISASSGTEPTEEPIPPCGACRQAIAEYEVKQNTKIKIFFMGATGSVACSHSLANLLPFIFKGSML